MTIGEARFFINLCFKLKYWVIFFSEPKIAISRGFVKWNPLGDLWNEIPSYCRGFHFTNPPSKIPRLKSPAWSLQLKIKRKFIEGFVFIFHKNKKIVTRPRKKYVQNSGFWSGIFPDPHPPFGDFENSLGQHAVPSGIFKIPSGLRGSGLKSPLKNLNFLFKFQDKCHLKFPIYRELSEMFVPALKQLDLADKSDL